MEMAETGHFGNSLVNLINIFVNLERHRDPFKSALSFHRSVRVSSVSRIDAY